jgi:HSP20 family protein
MANESRPLARRQNTNEPTAVRPFSAGAMLRPFALLREMTDWMDQAFEGDLPVTRGERMWTPAVEVREAGNNLVVAADLPGIDPNDVKIEVDNNTLVIQGERKREEHKEGQGFSRSERFYGVFFRAIPLPENAKLDEARAEFRNGVLEVTVPMNQEQMQRKQIPIQGAQAQGAASSQGASSHRSQGSQTSSQERQPQTTTR